jgi:RNA polymerase sigma-70 factor, ECF subfamily
MGIHAISVIADGLGFVKAGNFFETEYRLHHTNVMADEVGRQIEQCTGDCVPKGEAHVTSSPQANAVTSSEAKAITSDECTLAALKRQDPNAFSQLVATHQRIVVGLGQSMGLRGADLEDATAEAFAAIYRALPKFEARSALSTWVYQISCRTFWRVRQRRDANPTKSLEDDHVDARHDSPMDRAAASEEEQLIWTAVAALEPRQATAVELHYRRGFPLEEIALIMECPEGTIKTLLFRARDRLRQRLSRLDAASNAKN